jgi:hypothetical protein
MKNSNNKTNRDQTHFIKKEVREKLSEILKISLIGVKKYLPKNTNITFLLDGTEPVEAKTNAYCSARSPDLKKWFGQKAVETPYAEEVNKKGQILLTWT